MGKPHYVKVWKFSGLEFKQGERSEWYFYKEKLPDGKRCIAPADPENELLVEVFVEVCDERGIDPNESLSAKDAQAKAAEIGGYVRTLYEKRLAERQR